MSRPHSAIPLGPFSAPWTSPRILAFEGGIHDMERIVRPGDAEGADLGVSLVAQELELEPR